MGFEFRIFPLKIFVAISIYLRTLYLLSNFPEQLNSINQTPCFLGGLLQLFKCYSICMKQKRPKGVNKSNSTPPFVVLGGHIMPSQKI